MKATKLLASLLSAAMVLGSMCFTASAETDTMPAASDGVITLVDDVTLDEYTISSDTVLDLNGFTFTGAIKITGGDNVTLKNGTVISDADYAVTVTSRTGLTLDNVVIKGLEHEDASGTGGIYFNNSGTYFNMTDSEIHAGDVKLVNASKGSYSTAPQSALYLRNLTGDVKIIDSKIYSGSILHDEIIDEYNDSTSGFFRPSIDTSIDYISTGNLTIIGCEIYGGNNDVGNAGEAALKLQGKGANVAISNTLLQGGNAGMKSNDPSHGIGGAALDVTGNNDSTVIVIENSNLIGGKGAQSWGGCGISIGSCSPKKFAISDSTIAGGSKGRNGYGAGIYHTGHNLIDTFELNNVEISQSEEGTSYGAVKTNGQIVAKASGDVKLTGAVDDDFFTTGDANVTVRDTVNDDYKAADFTAVAQAHHSYYGDGYYASLSDAIIDALSVGAEVTLLKDSYGEGIVIPAGKTITVDFGGHTYSIGDPTVGSAGTETNGFQLLKDANVTFKNGTIYSKKAYILIQNYANLTLEDMNLNLETVHPNGTRLITLSNNNGDTVLTGNTNITTIGNNIAFDIYGGWYPDYPSVSVTLDENMTGTIDGDINIANGHLAEPGNFKLLIKNGTVTGNIEDNRTAEQKAAYPNVNAITGGTFSTDVSDYCADGFSAKLVGGKYVVDETANKITLKFVSAADKVYDIVLNGNGQNINRLNTADFTFAIDNTAVSYTIAPADGIALVPVIGDENRYEFHFNGKTGTATDTDAEIKIGTVTFTGYGKFVFNVVADAETNLVTATSKGDNLVTEFVTVALESQGTLVLDDKIDTEFTVPTKKLTVNITFPNAVNANEADYQQMVVTIAGGAYSETIDLGAYMVNGGYVIERDLTENTPYTVTVSGAGYRTARYTVTLNSDKTLNFWNNVKDTAVAVEEGNTNSAKNVTFLAGDIVKDNVINIYDLSAVVSYFGESGLSVSNKPEYAKYDLNRDGKIDSKDVAYVLVSWGK